MRRAWRGWRRHHESLEQARVDGGAQAAQGGRLLLAAAFGQGFGEVGEQHGEPEPYRDRQDEARRGLGLPRSAMIHRIVVRMLPA